MDMETTVTASNKNLVQNDAAIFSCMIAHDHTGKVWDRTRIRHFQNKHMVMIAGKKFPAVWHLRFFLHLAAFGLQLL